MEGAPPFRTRSRFRWRRVLVRLASALACATVPLPASAQTSPTAEEKPPVVEAPQLLSAGEVPYPEGAEGEAVVAVKLLISADGSVAEVKVVDGEEPFATAAQKAALSFEFSPARQDGEARAAWILYRIEYSPPVIEDPPEAAPPPREERSAPAAAEESPEEIEVKVEGVRRPGVGRVMSDAETQIIPGAEGDPLRSIEAMPGTVPILASGPFLGLRGATPGMVGYAYDGISMPYLFHLARGPAVVHPWMVQSAAIHGGGAPARLGRSAGGFVEATAAASEGRVRGSARVRATDSALGAEVPFAKGDGAFLAAGRYSYTRPLVSLIAPEFSLNYWDYQTRLRYRITPRDEIEVLGFGAGDRSSIILEDEPREDLFYGSLHRAALRYTRYRESGGKHRVGVVYSHDRWDGGPSLIRPYLHGVQLLGAWEEPLSRKAWLEIGADFATRFQTDFFYEDLAPEDEVTQYDRNDVIAGTYVDFTFAPRDSTTLALGLRLDLYNSDATPLTDAATAGAVQPRYSISHQATDVVRLHNSVGLSAQPRSPAQRPPGREYSPDGGLQYAALSDVGVEFQLPARFSLDTTVFHNAFFNVGDVEHLRFLRGQDREIKTGRGQAYGFEVALKRMLAARLRGFLAYTLSKSWRSIHRVRGPSQFDRPHVVDAALAYDFGKGWSLSSRATYYRGYKARVVNPGDIDRAPRSNDHYQLDWQVAKRWELREDKRWWGITMGVLNTNLRSEANDYFCDADFRCEQELVGPATIPTIGVEGEL